MNRFFMLPTLVVCAFFSMSAVVYLDETTKAHQLVRQMFDQTSKVKTLTYTMWKTERHKGELVTQQSFVKLQRSPIKVYSIQSLPQAGIEVLYLEGEHNNHALINPNGFPWVSFHLDPYGSVMRKGQHHIIQRSGFDHVASILVFLYDKYGDETMTMTKFDGDTIWRGRESWMVSFNNPYFKYVPYTVAKGENLVRIAEKLKLCEHMMLEINPKLSNYDDVKEGDVIKIPNDYASKMTLYIDKEYKLPLVMKVYDDKGLYEQYEFRDLVVNPVFTANDFSPDNPNYGF